MMKRLETSNGGWFWRPLEMVDMEPLSALNSGHSLQSYVSTEQY